MDSPALCAAGLIAASPELVPGYGEIEVPAVLRI